MSLLATRVSRVRATRIKDRLDATVANGLSL